MKIRKMEEKDRNTVFKMMRTFYDSPALLTKAPDEVLYQDIDNAISNMPFLDGFVFTDASDIIGYAMTAKSYTTEYGGLSLWIEDLYIIPEYRRQGIGTMFFKFLEKEYPDVVRFNLEVEKENEPAIANYKKNGFLVSGYFEMIRITSQE